MSARRRLAAPRPWPWPRPCSPPPTPAPGRPPSWSRCNRDARRLVPRTLARLMAEREKEIFEEARALPARAGAGPGRRPGERRAARRRPSPPWTARGLEAVDAAPRAAGERGRHQAGGAAAHPRRPLRSRALRGAGGLSARASPASTTRSSSASLDKIPVVLDDAARAAHARAAGLGRLLAGDPRAQPRSTRR